MANVFLWRVSGELQAAHDLHDPKEWEAYIAWFLTEGVNSYHLAPLISERWKQKVRQYTASRIATHADIPFNLQWAYRESPKPFVKLNEAKVFKQRPFGVNLIGFAFGELGIGEDIRMAAEEFEEVGIPVSIVNISPGHQVRQKDLSLLKYLKPAEEEEAPYAFNVFCLTGFDTARVYLEKGPKLFEGRYNIGWWPWELPVWPKRWQLAFDLVDEVWAGSTYAYETFAQAVKQTRKKQIVKRVPLRVSIAKLKPMTRQALNLPKDRYLFLYVFDSNSYLARKNPMGALKAFQQSFPKRGRSENISNKKVGIVFKTINPKNDNPEYRHFKKKCLADGRVTLLERTLDRGEVLGLMQACYAYISPHRAEGFGRTIKDALMLGKPTFATDFSGNTDFEGYVPIPWKKVRLKKGEYPFVTPEDRAWWAEPSDRVNLAAVFSPLS